MDKSLVTEDGASQGNRRLGLEGGPVFVGFVDGIMLGRRLVTMEAKLLATEGILGLEDGKALGK